MTSPYNKVDIRARSCDRGTVLWSYDPKSYVDGQPPNGTGYVHRGIAAWRDGNKLRIFLNTRYRLMSLDAKTGQPVNSFGDNGVVDLSQGLVWPINKMHYTGNVSAGGVQRPGDRGKRRGRPGVVQETIRRAMCAKRSIARTG